MDADKKPIPRMAKAHSKLVADEYLRLGWTLRREFFATEEKDESGYIDEPYEYFFEWCQNTDPVHIDWKVFHRKYAAKG